jgi:hypothetical protein
MAGPLLFLVLGRLHFVGLFSVIIIILSQPFAIKDVCAILVSFKKIIQGSG